MSDPVTPDLRAALREAFTDVGRDATASDPPRVEFSEMIDALRDNLRRMDALGMNWRGR